MIHHRISDWDDAYANGPHIAGGEAWPERWAQAARAFREEPGVAGRARLDLAYGGAPRNRFVSGNPPFKTNVTIPPKPLICRFASS